MELDPSTEKALGEYLLFLGDDRLILGHRLSEWCGHAPALEEDIALANIALDCIGHASWFLALAARVQGGTLTADDLVFHRDANDFRNHLLVEQPNGDFGFTIARQFFADVYWKALLEALTKSTYQPLAAIAEKALKEVTYHLRHSAEWIARLGDGTTESHERIQKSVDALWPFVAELFQNSDADKVLIERGIIPTHADLRAEWEEAAHRTLRKATLRAPEERDVSCAGRVGKHTAHLVSLLGEMQSLARAHPGVTW